MKKRKNVQAVKRYVTDRLTPDELSQIDRLHAVEDVWFGRWADIIDNDGDPETHWCYAGEDGHRTRRVELLGSVIEREELLIDMRGNTYVDSQTGETIDIGWVKAERIIPWERGVVPTTINWFINRFFGVELFGYQLFFYYQTTPKIMIVGGRGSAKTRGLALTMAAWTALHPGEAWAHFAYQGSQALEAYNGITELGEDRIPGIGQSEKDAPFSFFEVFVKSNKLSPYAQIDFIPWDIYDSGNKILFRPLGHRHGGTSARSMSVQRASLDEVTHDLPDKNVISVVEGTIRGMNEYWIKRLPENMKKTYREASILMKDLDETSRKRPLTDDEAEMLKRIKVMFRKYRITTHLGAIRTGNRGPYLWVDEDLQYSLDNPGEMYARVVSYLINPHLDYKARRTLEATYPDPIIARTELFAERAIGSGGWFNVSHLLAAESQQMDEKMNAQLALDVPGYSKQMYGANLTHWQMPYRRGMIYVLGSDPGTGMVPRRDSWNVQVWELDMSDEDNPKARLVFFRWGNTFKRATGSWGPYLAAQAEAIEIYKIPRHNAIVQVGGQERGVLEAAYGARQKVNAVNVTTAKKASWANWTRQLIAGGYLNWPRSASSLTSQLSDWQMKDEKLIQDLVMGLFAASSMIFKYFERFISSEEEEEEEVQTYHKRNLGRRRKT